MIGSLDSFGNHRIFSPTASTWQNATYSNPAGDGILSDNQTKPPFGLPPIAARHTSIAPGRSACHRYRLQSDSEVMSFVFFSCHGCMRGIMALAVSRDTVPCSRVERHCLMPSISRMLLASQSATRQMAKGTFSAPGQFGSRLAKDICKQSVVLAGFQEKMSFIVVSRSNSSHSTAFVHPLSSARAIALARTSRVPIAVLSLAMPQIRPLYVQRQIVVYYDFNCASHLSVVGSWPRRYTSSS